MVLNRLAHIKNYVTLQHFGVDFFLSQSLSVTHSEIQSLIKNQRLDLISL